MPQRITFQGDKSIVANEARNVREAYFKKGGSLREAFDNIFRDKSGTTQYVSSDHVETLEVRPDGFTIFLPHSTSAVRDNFTIAHELGHYFLHTNASGTETITHTREGSNLCEWQANWFAAELLMPEDEFREAAKKFKNNPAKIAAHFSVSEAAARVRMTVLGLDE
ncbi:MAG: ImmA/IrrE family metallo-endopeptidase [Desulfovibrionaceae bacterium]